MNPVENRLATLEQRVESVFALDARLKSLDDKVAQAGATSTFREWVGTLGPYVIAVMTLLVGHWINDTVSQGLQREQLDLQYGQQVRDLVKDFDAADTQGSADANAIGLAMFGRRATLPLLDRLEGGDVAHLAAIKGLLVIAANDPKSTCVQLGAVLQDRGQRYAWQTHKAIIQILGQAGCQDSVSTLSSYRSDLKAAKSSAAGLAQFARRYSDGQGFDIEKADAMLSELTQAETMLGVQAA
jgi:hypothetical protein